MHSEITQHARVNETEFCFQHQYHTKIDDFLERVQVQMVKCIIEKLLSVLESVLAKLARYDEGTFFSSILSLTVSVSFNLLFKFSEEQKSMKI